MRSMIMVGDQNDSRSDGKTSEQRMARIRMFRRVASEVQSNWEHWQTKRSNSLRVTDGPFVETRELIAG